jgi:hypothetical protein
MVCLIIELGILDVRMEKESSIADSDPRSYAFLTPQIRDTGSRMGKKSRPGFGMNIPDHIS